MIVPSLNTKELLSTRKMPTGIFASPGINFELLFLIYLLMQILYRLDIWMHDNIMILSNYS